MGDDGGVEFLHPEPDPGASRPADDVLETGPRRPIPRWAIALVGLGIAVAVVLALTLTGDDAPDSAPSSAPATGGLPSSFAIPPPDNLPLTLTYEQTTTVPHGPIQAAALGADGTLYVLSPGYLTTVGSQLSDVRVTKLRGFTTPQSTQWQLVPIGNRLWIVGSSPGRTQLAEIDTASMAVVARTALDRRVTSIATLDGRVYLATPTAVYDIAPNATRPRLVPGLLGGPSITADTTRHRLLLLNPGQTTVVRAYRPGGSTDVAGISTAPVVKGRLRVAGSTIWLGGFGPGGAVLTRLDPATLRPIAASPLANNLGPGAVIVAAGDHDVWVRDGGSSGDGLWCVGGSGAVAQHWEHAGGSIASRAGTVYLTDNSTSVHRLHLNAACRG